MRAHPSSVTGIRGALIALAPSPSALAFVLIAAVLSTRDSAAFSLLWQGASGDWFSAGNWIDYGQTVHLVPRPEDDASVSNGGIAHIASGSATAANLHVTSGSQLVLSGGSFTLSQAGYAYAEIIGTGLSLSQPDTGSMIQTGGTNSTIRLILGFGAAHGTYELSGDGQVSAQYEVIGAYSGTGLFRQNGGTNVTVGLYLGSGHVDPNPGGVGTYDLQLGTLSVLGGAQVGLDGGVGTLELHNGAMMVAGELSLGSGTGSLRSSGTVHMLNGSLTVGYESVGVTGGGEFTQAGGIHTVTGPLALATTAGATASFNLEGGSLSAGTLITNANATFTNASSLKLTGWSWPATSTGGIYTQVTAGALEVLIGGEHFHGQLIVGQANLAGALTVSTTFGYMPNAGERFEIVTGVINGAFGDVTLPPGWSLEYGPNSVCVIAPGNAPPAAHLIAAFVHGQIPEAFWQPFGTFSPPAWATIAAEAADYYGLEISQQRVAQSLAPVSVQAAVFDWAQPTSAGATLLLTSRSLWIMDDLRPLSIPALREEVRRLAMNAEDKGRRRARFESNVAALRFASELNTLVESTFGSAPAPVLIDVVGHSRGGAVASQALRNFQILRLGSGLPIEYRVSLTLLDAIDPDPAEGDLLPRPKARAGFLLNDPRVSPVVADKRSAFVARYGLLSQQCDEPSAWFGGLRCWALAHAAGIADDWFVDRGWPRGHLRNQSPGSPFTIETLMLSESHGSIPEKYATALGSMVVGSQDPSLFQIHDTSYLGAMIQNPLVVPLDASQSMQSHLDWAAQAPADGQPLTPGANLVADADFADTLAFVEGSESLLADAEFQAALTQDLAVVRGVLEGAAASRFVDGAWTRTGQVSAEPDDPNAVARFDEAGGSLTQGLDNAASNAGRFYAEILFEDAGANPGLAAWLSDGACGWSASSGAAPGPRLLTLIGDRCGQGCAFVRVPPTITLSGQSVRVRSVRVSPIPMVDGDADLNGVVDFLDLNIVLSFYGQQAPAFSMGDLDGDGDCDFIDLNIVLSNYGTGC